MTLLIKPIKGLLCLLLLNASPLLAQEKEGEEFNPRIRGAIMMANSHIPKAFEDGTRVSIIPTWGFDIDYFFHSRWSVAFQGDIKLQSFEIEEKNNVSLERDFPIALATVIHYHALRHWSFYVGPGVELEQNENLFLMRLGTEYSFEITENFEIALNLIWENKDEVYDTWTFGIAFNKKIWEKNRSRSGKN
jgi:hypothetical protein